MKINWKLRFQNPLFIVQIVAAFFLPILAYMGLTAQDMTTWSALFDVVKHALSNPYCVLIILTSVYNCVVDFTTKGIGDSESVISQEKIT